MLKFAPEVKEETPRSRDVATPTVTLPTPLIPSSYSDDTHRVRPDELAEALFTLEQKKRKAFTGTLPLEQSLAQMNVDATEQEVWNEIQQRRLKKKGLPSKKHKKPEANIFLGLTAIFFTLVAVILAMSTAYPQQAETVRGILGDGIDTITGKIAPVPSVNTGDYNADDISRMGFPTVFNRTPTMKPLSEVKDGEVLSLSSVKAQILQKSEQLGTKTKEGAELTELLKNALVETKPNPKNPQVVRYNHQWYLRGWTTKTPLPLHDYNNKGPVDTIVFFREPMKDVKGIRSLPLPSPPPGTSPKEISKHYTIAKEETASFGPADKQVQVPIKFVSDRIITGAGPDPTFSAVSEGQYDFHLDGERVDIKNLDSHAWDKW